MIVTFDILQLLQTLSSIAIAMVVYKNWKINQSINNRHKQTVAATREFLDQLRQGLEEGTVIITAYPKEQTK